MAYSKFHHGGCNYGGSHEKNFNLKALLQCVWDYAVVEQEFATSASLAASEGAHPPHLILYEDVLAHPSELGEDLASILGHRDLQVSNLPNAIQNPVQTYYSGR